MRLNQRLGQTLAAASNNSRQEIDLFEVLFFAMQVSEVRLPFLFPILHLCWQGCAFTSFWKDRFGRRTIFMSRQKTYGMKSIPVLIFMNSIMSHIGFASIPKISIFQPCSRLHVLNNRWPERYRKRRRSLKLLSHAF